MSPFASHFALGIPCFHRVWNYRRAARPAQHIPKFHRSKHWSPGSYSIYFSAEFSCRPQLSITWLQNLSRAKTPPNSRFHFHLPQEPAKIHQDIYPGSLSRFQSFKTKTTSTVFADNNRIRLEINKRNMT